MNLAIDIGNTRTKLAVFDDDQLVAKMSIHRDEIDELRAICQKWQIRQVIVSSTGQPWVEEKIFEKVERLVFLDHQTLLPIENEYDTPKTLGKDRLAGVVGAHALFGSKNNLIVDAGTCVTYDFITSGGSYLGGNIAPGLKMRYEAMDKFTFALPLVDAPSNEAPKMLLGTSTENALQLGGLKGLLFEIEGYRKALKKEYGKINIILTGGDGQYLASFFKRKIFVSPDLVLIGLNEILRYQNHLYE